VVVLFAVLLFLKPPVPGATNPNVTQANIHTTICVRGWTATIRPPLPFSSVLKRKLYRAEHLTGGLRAYELDHLVPLEAGGAPSDLNNLWMEPIHDALVKDRLENSARARICAGRLTLAQGQALFLHPSSYTRRR